MHTHNTPRGNTGTGLSGLTILLGVLAAFAPFATDMYLAAFPAMASSLHTDVGGIQMTLSVFFLGMGLGQLFYGPVIDRFGRRKPLLAGIGLYAITSFCLIPVTNLPLFLVLRFFQAVGGCAGMIIGRAIVRDCFDLNGAARVFSLMMVVQAIGPVAAPVIGGYILGWSTWHTIFVTLGVIGVTCFALVFLYLPETLPQQERQQQSVMKSIRTFVQIFNSRKFAVPAVSGGIGGAAMFAFISGSPFIFMSLYGLNAKQYGWAFGLFALGLSGSGPLNTALLKRYTPSAILAAALASSMLFSGILLVLLAVNGLPPFPLFCALLFFSLATIPVICANSTAISMSAAEKNTGSASSVIGGIQFCFAGLVSALTGILHDGSPYPMVTMIFICGMAAVCIIRFFAQQN